MKKLLLSCVAIFAMAINAFAEGGQLYLRSDLNGGSWGENLSSFQFSKQWDGSQDIYQLTIGSDKLIANTDFYFRLYREDTAYETCPYGNNNYTYVFENGQNETYSATSGSSFQGTNGAFCISHSTIKASEYKITVYLKYNDPWEYYIKVEIISMPVTIGSTGMATFCCNRALNFDGTGISAYTITGATKATGVLTTSAVTHVPANTGLYLEGSAGTVDVPVLVSADAIGTNMLVGVTEDTPISQTVGANTNYILTVNKDGGNVATPKFFKVNVGGNTVPAGKAYLQIPTASAAREFFWFGEDVTAIENVAKEQMVDGQVYNLAGQRVAQPTKGLYIVNGKKVIKK